MAGRILRTNSGDACTNPVLVGRRLPIYTVRKSVRPSTDPALVEARLAGKVRKSDRPTTDPASVEARLAANASAVLTLGWAIALPRHRVGGERRVNDPVLASHSSLHQHRVGGGAASFFSSLLKAELRTLSFRTVSEHSWSYPVD